MFKHVIQNCSLDSRFNSARNPARRKRPNIDCLEDRTLCTGGPINFESLTEGTNPINKVTYFDVLYQVSDFNVTNDIQFYWSTSSDYSGIIGQPAYTIINAQDYGEVAVPIQDFGSQPPSASYLLAVANVGGITYPTDNIAIELSTLTVTSPSFNDTNGGVNFSYTISNANLGQPTTVALYWASGTTFNTVIGDPIFSTITETSQGTYSVYVTPGEMGTIPGGAKYILAVADSKYSPTVAYLDLSGGAGNTFTNVILPDVQDPLQISGSKSSNSIYLHYKSIGLNFTINTPTDPNAISEALSNNGQLPISILDKTTGNDIPLGTSNAVVDVSVYGPVEAAKLSITPATKTIGNIVTGTSVVTYNDFLNEYTPGDAVFKWSTSGFSVTFDDTGVQIPVLNTGYLSYYVDLDKLGVDPADYSFQYITRIAESYIHQALTQSTFSSTPRLPLIARFMLSIDPGDTSLQVTDPQGNITGTLSNGKVVNNISGSVYFPSIPLVVIANPMAGIYQTQLTALYTTNYEFDSLMSVYSQPIGQQSFTGTLVQGQSFTYFTTVDATGNSVSTTSTPPIDTTSSGLVYNRGTQLFGGTITLTNNGSTALTGTLEVELTGLPAGVTLANASGIAADGNPYILINLADYSFAGGQSLNFTVLFSDPTKESFQYGLDILDS